MGVDYSVVGGWGIVVTEDKLIELSSKIEKIIEEEFDAWDSPYELARKYGLEAVEAGNHLSDENIQWLFGVNTYSKDLHDINSFGFMDSGREQDKPDVQYQINLDRLIFDLGLGLNYKPRQWTGFKVS